MASDGVETIDDYLDALPAPRREALERVRAVIRRAAPEATERIAYRIPIFALHGDLVGMAAQARHLSFYTMSPDLTAAMKDRLAPFKASGATIHFSESDPLPDELIEEVVAARIEENLARRRK